MIISSKLKGKKYKDGVKLDDDESSYYIPTHKDIVIYLPQVLEHSKDCTIEQAFTQHVTHELVHKLLDENEDIYACKQFDNLGSKKVCTIEGKFSLRNWFGGMLNKEV